MAGELFEMLENQTSGADSGQWAGGIFGGVPPVHDHSNMTMF